MSTISPNRFASPNSQTSAVNKEANPLNEDFNHAKRVMADEMKRLYPDSVMDTKSTLVTLDQQSLDHIVKNGTLRSANGDLVPVSDDVRNAAQTILDNGGPTVINPKGDPWFSEADLRKSLEPEPEPLQALQPVQPGEATQAAQRGDIRD
ncbi:hypothetical protein RY831_13975 [Noviherbaspirillum sp. CPCC 100848]|uniref:Uncharacterized protein n=1 Tax=Noviherbaspirillum album TaxID=3080276 RepID=A0ABU6J9E5_9BURK|nr:hypothetical protein [Noviherbaspirillum sp. CPCC 100848]MEC4720264.1 hypothetical protein [Noviherbaspirillum sp. CPCC 100848]